MNVYGYINGKPVYSSDEFIYASRGFGTIETDDELMRYAEKVTSNWYDAGWHHTFRTYYLSNYALSEPCASLTTKEFNRLKELQKIACEEYEAKERAKEWRYVETIYWADNSEEEVWEDKDGNRKTIMTCSPHGDVC